MGSSGIVVGLLLLLVVVPAASCRLFSANLDSRLFLIEVVSGAEVVVVVGKVGVREWRTGFSLFSSPSVLYM